MKTYLHILLALIGILFFANCNKSASLANVNSTVGKAGSLSRFAMVGNYLYAINNQTLSVFNATNPQSLTFVSKMDVGEGIETIFPFRDKLFIASNNGMYMYNISNPAAPSKESFVQHLTGCDPVVANETHAFLTIHSGRRCGANGLNVLQVYKLDANIANPIFVTQVNMTNPIGLGLHEQYLFVCDKGNGLVVFDISDPKNPELKQTIKDENYLDVIPYGNLLVCMLEDGIAYYDISDMNNIQKLSVLN